MLKLNGKKVLIEKSELLYTGDFTKEQLDNDFEVATGEWSVDNGWLTGYLEKDGGGIIYSKKHYYGDILMDFEARTVAPYDNDINFTFCAKGWDKETNYFGLSYIGGLEGWWFGKTGIERCPDWSLFGVTGMHKFEVGKTYHIQTGRVGTQLFLFIDEELAVEVKDPNPITEYGKVGFGVYASKIQYKNFKLYKPYSEVLKTSYAELRGKK